MSEMAPVGEESNRLFIIIAVALVGLLIIGLLGVGGFVFFTRLQGNGEASPTAIAAATATRTPAPTFTATPLAATATPTKVVGEGEGQVTATPTVMSNVGNGNGQTPDAGFGPLEAFLTGIGLIAVVVVARKFRVGSGGGIPS